MCYLGLFYTCRFVYIIFPVFNVIVFFEHIQLSYMDEGTYRDSKEFDSV